MDRVVSLSAESDLVDQIQDILLDSRTDIVRRGKNELVIFKNGKPYTALFFIQSADSLVVSLSSKNRVRRLLYDYRNPSLDDIRRITMDLLLVCGE